MKIAIAQITTDPGRLNENADKIIEYIGRARQAGARLVVFPELCVPGYGHLDLVYQNDFIRRNLEILKAIAQQTGNIIAVVGFVDCDFDRTGPGGKPVLFNSAAVIHDRHIAGTVDKTLLAHYDIFSEQRYFSSGLRQGIIEVDGLKLGIGICEDLWSEGYSDQVYQDLLAKNPDLLINLSASPFAAGKLIERLKQIDKTVRSSGPPFVYANLIGSFDGYHGEVVFDGHSMIKGSDGNVLGIARGFSEDLLVVDLETAKPISIEAPDATDEIHQALLLGIRDYFRRTGFKRAYIGLSGGIDSALVAALAAEALGKENVVGVTMPSHITSSETKADAIQLADNFGIRCEVRPIENEYRAWEEEFKRTQGKEPDSLTRQNKQARIRGAILMEYTNEDSQSLVISTGNKTELALGYCTLYGDMCGGFAAISDVSKERVYLLARLINKKAGKELIPGSIIDRVPTAELEEGQTDQANLPADYDILSPLVDAIVDKQLPYLKLCELYNQETVDKTLRLVHLNEFKRRQAAPGIRVTNKAFGIGRRFPIVHGFWRS